MIGGGEGAEAATVRACHTNGLKFSSHDRTPNLRMILGPQRLELLMHGSQSPFAKPSSIGRLVPYLPLKQPTNGDRFLAP
jgi:hypothetical protein